jgi:hypothetical protein
MTGGAVEHIVCGGGSRGRFGQHHCLNRGVKEGLIKRRNDSYE